eukprot:Opistho-1_new@51879
MQANRSPRKQGQARAVHARRNRVTHGNGLGEPHVDATEAARQHRPRAHESAGGLLRLGDTEQFRGVEVRLDDPVIADADGEDAHVGNGAFHHGLRDLREHSEARAEGLARPRARPLHEKFDRVRRALDVEADVLGKDGAVEDVVVETAPDEERAAVSEKSRDGSHAKEILARANDGYGKVQREQDVREDEEVEIGPVRGQKRHGAALHRPPKLRHARSVDQHVAVEPPYDLAERKAKRAHGRLAHRVRHSSRNGARALRHGRLALVAGDRGVLNCRTHRRRRQHNVDVGRGRQRTHFLVAWHILAALEGEGEVGKTLGESPRRHILGDEAVDRRRVAGLAHALLEHVTL